MKNQIDYVLNEILVTLFRKINTIERLELITDEFKDISYNDMHIIEVIGKEEGCSVSCVAQKLGITLASVNIAMNALVRKGYIIRQRSLMDKRVVLVSLTDKGISAFDHHESFHNRMIEAVTERISDEEKDLFVKSLTGMTDFFNEVEKKALMKEKKRNQ